MTDHSKSYLPGHFFRVRRGPFEGVIGQWAGSYTDEVCGLIWPDMPRESAGLLGVGARPVQFRLADLEDLTTVSVPEVFRDALD